MAIWDKLINAASGLGRWLSGGGDPATDKITFTIGVIALSAKMAKADGEVTQDEVEAFRDVFSVPAHEIKNVSRVYDIAKRDTAGFESYAKQLAKLFEGHKTVLEDLLDALFHIAKADNVVHDSEMNYIRQVGEIFGFSEGEFERMAARHVGPDRSSPYTVLGVSPDISEEDLKATYRQLVKKNHPDRLVAQGLPREFIAVANDRIAAINEAYERICAQRNIAKN